MMQQNLIENCTPIRVFKVTSCLVEEFFYFYMCAHKKTAPVLPRGRFLSLNQSVQMLWGEACGLRNSNQISRIKCC